MDDIEKYEKKDWKVEFQSIETCRNFILYIIFVLKIIIAMMVESLGW